MLQLFVVAVGPLAITYIRKGPVQMCPAGLSHSRRELSKGRLTPAGQAVLHDRVCHVNIMYFRQKIHYSFFFLY